MGGDGGGDQFGCLKRPVSPCADDQRALTDELGINESHL